LELGCTLDPLKMHATISAPPGLTPLGILTVTTNVPSGRTEIGLLASACGRLPW